MGNHQRDDEAGAYHHVVNRGARRHQTFESQQDCTYFLYLLGEAQREYGIETHAYCLMGNHYHLLVRSVDGELSSAMAMIGSAYTRRFNRRHGYDGPLFKSAFRSRRVDTDTYLLQASRYIHRNPIDLGPTVEKTTYNWSSYRHYLGSHVMPQFLTTSVVLGIAGGPGPYREYVGRSQQSDEELHWSAAALAAHNNERTLVVPGAVDIAVAFEVIAAAVAMEFGVVSPDIARSRRRAERQAKMVALLLSLRLSGLDPGRIATIFGFSNSDTMNASLRRVRRGPDGARLETDVARIQARLLDRRLVL